MTLSPSSERSLIHSHRGDSGSQIIPVTMTIENAIWKAIGNLQEKLSAP